MDLMAAAEELYGLPLGEFVARRNALAKQTRESGDKDLSAQVKRLAKPSTAAWMVNMLVRHEPEQLEQVLELGAALREAQASMAGDELRVLGRQRRQLTAAVTREARSLAVELGEKVADAVADQVEGTLHAAMVDEDAAKAVRTGFLVKPLAVTGTEAADVVDSVAVPTALGEAFVRRTPSDKDTRKRPQLTVVEDRSRAVEEAEAELQRVEQKLADAERKLEKASRKVQKREAKGLQLQAELDELRRKVADLEQRLENNEDELAEAEVARELRAESLEEARKAVDRARSAREALRG